jgi:molybdopterin converting factor small subunit
VRICFYGRLADTIGREVEIDMGRECSVGELRSRIATLYPHAADDLASPRVKACVGETIVPDGFRVRPDQNVEILAPLSGG